MTGAERRAAHAAAVVRISRAVGLAARRRRLPRQQPPDALARDYAADLRALVARARAALGPLLDALPRLAQQVRLERARLDVGEGDEVRRLADQAELTSEISDAEAEAIALRHAERVSRYQAEQLRRQMVAGLGVALLMPDISVRANVDGFVAENASVIRDVPTRVVADVEQAGIRLVNGGATVEELNAAIEKAFAAGDARAQMVATIEVRKLYAQLNTDRQRELGLAEFKWRTMMDGKVRPWHREREGVTYAWSAPPDGEVPGGPINCRCYAEPVFAEVLRAAAAPAYSVFD